MRIPVLACSLIVLSGTAASLHAQARQTPPPAAAAAAATDVAVTVTYTGKGVVDAGHQILVFLFADPNIGPNSRPLGPPQIAEKNGATLKFTNVTTKPVYVFAIYNEKGTYDGRSGPPPAGTPIGMLTNAKGPVAVTPGAKTPARLTFAGDKKWGQ